MFKQLKRWWKLKKMAKAIWKQVEREKKRDAEHAKYTEERVKEWLEKNEFGLRLKDLNSHCVERVTRRTKNIEKYITDKNGKMTQVWVR
jgi:hypothetical protein